MAASFAVGFRLDLCNAPTGVKGQTLAKRVRLLGKSTRSYGKPSDEVSLVLRWTSKLGRCLIRQSKRSCSEATTGKTISDKSSTGTYKAPYTQTKARQENTRWLTVAPLATSSTTEW